MFFQVKKAARKKNRVLFIDASELQKKGRAQNYFLPEHASTIIKLYEQYSDVEGKSRIAGVDEISKNDYNLNISRYVKKKNVAEVIDLKETSNELENAYQEFLESEKKFKSLLREIGI